MSDVHKSGKTTDEPVVVVVADTSPMDLTIASPVPRNEKMTKTPKKKNTPSKAKSPMKHPPWNQMIVEAIVALKDRTGSSNVAVKKWIVAQYPAADNERLKTNLNKGLKSGISGKRLIRNKASFKIHPEFKKKMKAKQSTKAKAKKKPSAAQIAAQKEKERLAAKEKARLERIRKRKFPMEDLKLIAEDKELGVSVKLSARPSLPCVTPGNSSKAFTSETQKPGILEDAFLIYHFFRGDVGWGLIEKNGVAPFTLCQWLECIRQVQSGASKRSKLLPPLMTHLFVVALQHLVPPALRCALTPASWLEILMIYQGSMANTWEAYEAESKIDALPIDVEYLLHRRDDERDLSELEGSAEQVPYLNDKMANLFYKIQQCDPWTLSIEELLSLLVLLVDDLLANSPEIAMDLDDRLQETSDLLKNKRSADANFRKLQTIRNKELSEIKAEEKEQLELGKKATRSNTKSCSVSEAHLESARRAQQKATDAYERARKSRRIRTQPIGQDRNFHQVFHFWNDPQRVFVLKQGKKVADSNKETKIKLEGMDSYKGTWHSIDNRSTLESYLESLDVRGVRESALHHALEPACKLVFDDIKIANEKKAQLKEKLELQRKLENAKLKCEFGRKSGRLAAQSEQEFSILQADIDLLENIIKGKAAPRTVDLLEDTGLNMLRAFDNLGGNNRRRATRRDTQRQKEEEEESKFVKLLCSRLWSTGNIDGTGLVGSIVSELLQLEERVERLASCETEERKKWISNLETAAHSWHVSSPPFLEEVGNVFGSPSVSSKAIKKQKTSVTPGSVGSVSSSASATLSSAQILTSIRKPVLQLEERVYAMTGLAMAHRDADEADDNMSTSPEEEKEEQVQLAWKKIIHRLHRLPAKAHAKIRQIVVEGIAAARKAHNPVVVAALRNALLEFHAQAAGSCKSLALSALEQHGGYDDFDDSDEEDPEEFEQEELPQVPDQGGNGGFDANLPTEAIILSGCLDGKEDVTRQDWIKAVTGAKTFSKLASLAAGFITKASEKLEKIDSEHDKLIEVIEALEKASSLRNKKSSEEDISNSSEVWANVIFTDEIVLAKAGLYPYWPAKKCIPNEKSLSESLKTLGRTLVSLVGESGSLRVVKTADVLPISEELPEGEDLSAYSKDMRSQLEDCMTMTRRIIRGMEKKSHKTSKKEESLEYNDFKEEKKLAT